ncbi:MAG TPA: peptide chain release factor N(5)-glutamine methyltransferase [Thermotogota bacterium]|nr:peptide chain release factor N(5)-glutamine methyltransferase [Thermotogota bacterium]HQN21631.1 peptide chain release factor N(5)-glutamine methyltransferase [Thermotogota bacterium]HQQ65072.1 peptide chain release factor N(5)-glutamine methyltransferase [Thermotogota bacterium]
MEAEKAKKQWTVQELVGWTTGFFERKGLVKPRLSSELLLAEALKLDRTLLYTRWNAPVETAPLEVFRAYIQRYVEGEPIEYILGYRWFMTYRLEVNRDVLIPRVETEELIEWVAGRENGRSRRFLDLCTGSGAIGIALARAIPEATIVASDISEMALDVAQRNARTHQVYERITFYRSDFLDGLDNLIGPIEVVVCNPPYVGENDRHKVNPATLSHEPWLALFGGPDGLDFYRKTVENAPRLQGKRVYFEFGFDQKERLETLFSSVGTVAFKKDMYGQWRFLSIDIHS